MKNQTITNTESIVRANGPSISFSVTQDRIDLLERQMRKVIDCIESISDELDSLNEQVAELGEE